MNPEQFKTTEERPRILEGERVFLTPPQVDEAPIFYQWINDLDNARGTRFQNLPVTLSQEYDWLTNICEGKDPEYRLFTVIDKKTGQLIGNLGLKDFANPNRAAELGILIGNKQFQNQGYGPKAIVLLLDYGFNALNLNAIRLTVYAYNERAIKAYLKVGFKKSGRHREAIFYGGKYHDVIIMDILAREFRKLYPTQLK